MLLPLKYYDDAGRVKPAMGLYLLILYLCRSILVLIGALTMREYTDQLLAIVYPEQHFLYLSLLIALPALFTLFILGFREKIWLSGREWIFLLIKPLLALSILADLILHIVLANSQAWAFSWVLAASLLTDCLALFYIIKDQHIRLMVKDWRKGQVY
ncbi:DUF2919 family protein [Paraglaciecola aestuariivivens]